MTTENSFQYVLNGSLSKFNDSTAIEYGSRFITYSELDRRSNKIADFIIAQGIKNQTFIGLLINDRLELIVRVIGILKAGCVIVPLYSSYPNGRIETMINTTDIGYIFIDKENSLRFNTQGIQVQSSCKFFFLDQLLSEGDDDLKSKARLAIQFTPDDKLYIHFTSGTTGAPKAVLGKSKSLLHFINWEIEIFSIDSRFHVAQFTIPGFDPFLRDIFVPLCVGGMVCIPAREEILIEPDVLVKWVDKHQIGLIHCVSSLFRQLSVDYLTSNYFKALKCILLAGEKITPVDLIHWYDVFGERIQLVNCYGPTETTMSKVFYLISKSDLRRDRIPIGKPMKGSRIIILDEKMKICAPLDVGEIYIRTPFRSFGYYNDAGLNKEKFIFNPFNNDPDDILYRSGDLGRFLLDGNIDILGRVDRQVKIRGYRVELEEIERVLITHPLLEEAAVIKKEGPTGNEVLCAYITGENVAEGDSSFIDTLKEFLLEKLPDYMVPSYIKKIAKIPRGATGKINFKALPDPFKDRDSDIGPRNDIELRLLKLWVDILGIKNISINERFFELGGNSLNVMTLISKIYREFNVRITLGELFKKNTIEMQASVIAQAVKEHFDFIEKTEKKDYYPLSSAQKRIYIVQHMNEKNIGYNIPSAFLMEGIINKDRIENTFSKLITRHESLRTCFHIMENGPLQKILERAELDFRVEYIEGANEENEDEILRKFVRPFDLSKAPLMRTGIIKIEEQKHLLMVDMHHIISDGVSMSILVKEFMNIYAEKELPVLELQYKDFSEWMNRAKQKKQMEMQAAYWRKELAGNIPILELPVDYPRPEMLNFEGSMIPFILNKEENDALKALAIREEVTLYMVLLAAFNIILSKLSGSEDIIVGSPTAGRQHADLENIIGVFINTLALRNYPVKEKTFRDFLGEVKKRTLEAFENQDYPFEDLVEELVLNRDFSRHPLFDVMLVLQNVKTEKIEIPGVILSKYNHKSMVSKFDITLTCSEEDGGLHFSISYSTALFKQKTVAEFISYFRTILFCILEDNEIKLGDIDVISEEEKKRILFDFNNTAAEYPRTKTIQELFWEQVNRTPDNIAVVGEKIDITPNIPTFIGTYSEINKESNRLAYLLRKKSVKPDTIVAIIVDRSIETIIGILGILKAGGAFLPIDPNSPEKRINYMLSDCQARILVRGTRDNFNIKVYSENVETIFIDNLDPDNYEVQEERLEIPNAGNLAYVIYTSGTTGKSKGMLIENRNLVNYLSWFAEKINLTNHDRTLLTSSLAFDLGYTTVFSSLLNGGQLHIIPEAEGYSLDVDNLLKYIEKEEITYIKITPSFFNLMVHAQNFATEMCRSLKFIVLGGEPIIVKDVERARVICGHIRVMNHYGPTEATIGSAAAIIDFNRFAEYKMSPYIGKPVANARSYVLDKNLKPVPIGARGELCIAGDGVGRGYMNNPELTAVKFINNPFLKGDRLYCTGDLAHWQPDGNLKLAGRMDNQVKIKGYRIELGEIENRLLRHVDIKEAIVIAASSDDEQELAAYLVADRDISKPELKKYLSLELPGYMIPDYFVQLEHFPLTPNGKIDGKRLPRPVKDRSTLENAYIAPGNDLEELIAESWKEILKIGDIGVHDNFFDLGGNSLKIVLINNKLKVVLKKEIPIVTMFRHPTVAALAQCLADEQMGSEVQTGITNRTAAVERGLKSRLSLKSKRMMRS